MTLPKLLFHTKPLTSATKKKSALLSKDGS